MGRAAMRVPASAAVSKAAILVVASALLLLCSARSWRAFFTTTSSSSNSNSNSSQWILPDSSSSGPQRPLPPGVPGPLVFLHLPKTAGSSVTALLYEMFGELGCARDPLANRRLPLPPDGAPCVWAHAHTNPGDDDREFIARAAFGDTDRPGGRPVRLDFLLGHLPFGYCPVLNSGLLAGGAQGGSARGGARCAYTTVLRHPIERALSHYGYLLSLVPQVVLGPCPECADAEAFARELGNATGRLAPLRLDNLMTRLLAGDMLWSTLTAGKRWDVAAAADGAMLRAAMGNLAAHFPVIGFTEQLASYARELRAYLGLPPAPPPPPPPPAAAGSGAEGGNSSSGGAAPDAAAPPPAPRPATPVPSVPVVNPTPPRFQVRFSQLSPAARAALVRSQRYDLLLYRYARRLAAARRGGGGGSGSGAVSGGGAGVVPVGDLLAAADAPETACWPPEGGDRVGVV